jgi:hypothetical protein
MAPREVTLVHVVDHGDQNPVFWLFSTEALHQNSAFHEKTHNTMTLFEFLRLASSPDTPKDSLDGWNWNRLLELEHDQTSCYVAGDDVELKTCFMAFLPF